MPGARWVRKPPSVGLALLPPDGRSCEAERPPGGLFMSLSDLAALGNFIGGVAVVISFVFLAFQLRQSTHNQRTSIAIQRTALTQEIGIFIFTQDLPVWTRGGQADSSMTDEEIARYRPSPAIAPHGVPCRPITSKRTSKPPSTRSCTRRRSTPIRRRSSADGKRWRLTSLRRQQRPTSPPLPKSLAFQAHCPMCTR